MHKTGQIAYLNGEFIIITISIIPYGIIPKGINNLILSQEFHKCFQIPYKFKGRYLVVSHNQGKAFRSEIGGHFS